MLNAASSPAPVTSFGHIATETCGAAEDCHVRLLSNLLQRFIRQGTLRVRDADGNIHVFGERLPGPDVAIDQGGTRSCRGRRRF